MKPEIELKEISLETKENEVKFRFENLIDNLDK